MTALPQTLLWPTLSPLGAPVGVGAASPTQAPQTGAGAAAAAADDAPRTELPPATPAVGEAATGFAAVFAVALHASAAPPAQPVAAPALASGGEGPAIAAAPLCTSTPAALPLTEAASLQPGTTSQQLDPWAHGGLAASGTPAASAPGTPPAVARPSPATTNAATATALASGPTPPARYTGALPLAASGGSDAPRIPQAEALPEGPTLPAGPGSPPAPAPIDPRSLAHAPGALAIEGAAPAAEGALGVPAPATAPTASYVPDLQAPSATATTAPTGVPGDGVVDAALAGAKISIPARDVRAATATAATASTSIGPGTIASPPVEETTSAAGRIYGPVQTSPAARVIALRAMVRGASPASDFAQSLRSFADAGRRIEPAPAVVTSAFAAPSRSADAVPSAPNLPATAAVATGGLDAPIAQGSAPTAPIDAPLPQPAAPSAPAVVVLAPGRAPLAIEGALPGRTPAPDALEAPVAASPAPGKPDLASAAVVLATPLAGDPVAFSSRRQPATSSSPTTATAPHTAWTSTTSAAAQATAADPARAAAPLATADAMPTPLPPLATEDAEPQTPTAPDPSAPSAGLVDLAPRPSTIATANAHSAAPATAAALTRQVADGIVMTARDALLSGAVSAELQVEVDPPHLGTVQVRVAVSSEDHSIEVIIAARHAVAREGIAAELERLQDSLAVRGLTIRHIAVEGTAATVAPPSGNSSTGQRPDDPLPHPPQRDPARGEERLPRDRGGRSRDRQGSNVDTQA